MPFNLKKLLKSTLLSISVFAFSLPLVAQANTIQSVSGSMQGGAEVIRIDLTEPLASVPTGFTVQTPARIALDFPGVDSSVDRSAVDLNVGNLRSANVIKAEGRTRVVLNLKESTTYKADIQGNSLLITLNPVVVAQSSRAPAPVFAENHNRDVLPLKDVDFKRGADNAGRVVVDLANNEVGVDIRQQGQNLVVEFQKSALPEGLRRRLNVVDFGTPVQTVTTFQTGDKVRMVVEPRGAWEHSAYQSNNQFVLEVRPQKVDATKLSQGAGYTGEKLSLNFQNIEIRSLLQVIADFTNFNIVTSDTVTGSVTLRLKDVPWDQALDIILQAKGLGRRKEGNVLLIAPKDEIAARDKQEAETRNSIQSLEEVKTQSFQINYAKASDIAAQLGTTTGTGTSTARLLSSRGSVFAEPRTNKLFVTDIPSKLEQVQNLISQVDIPVRQVLIEARIVEADDEFNRSLGIKMGGLPFNQNSNTAFGGLYNANRAGTTAGQFVNHPSTGTPTGTFAVSLFNSAATRFLNLEISASEDDGKLRVVSSPRLVTADQVKAIIEQGVELPYETASSSGATSIAFRKASLKLEVTPQITPEGGIILNVDVSNDSAGTVYTAGPAINTKHVQTQVLVENGGTIVLGGIFTQTDNVDENKVPVLGDIPVFGWLFKSTAKRIKKTELIVFITPKMINSGTVVQ